MDFFAISFVVYTLRLNNAAYILLHTSTGPIPILMPNGSLLHLHSNDMNFYS